MRARALISTSILVVILLTAFAVAHAAYYAYIPNAADNTVSVIDTEQEAVVATIPVGRSPVGVAVHPSGRKVYVTNQGDHTLSIIDVLSRSVSKTVAVGARPHGVAVHPDGSLIFVTNEGSDTLSVLDSASLAVIHTVTTGSAPRGVVVDPERDLVYVANHLSYTVTIVDLADGKAKKMIPVGPLPSGLALLPDATFLYAIGQDTLWGIDTRTQTEVLVRQGGGGYAAALSPSGTRLYMTNPASGMVYLFDTTHQGYVAEFRAGDVPQGAAVHPSGSALYVTLGGENTVLLVDMVTHAVLRRIAVGRDPRGFGNFIGAVPTPAPGCSGQGRAKLIGQVVSEEGRAPIGGVTLELDGVDDCTESAVTNRRGKATFRSLAPGLYTLSPSKAGCTFDPPHAHVTLERRRERVRFFARCE